MNDLPAHYLAVLDAFGAVARGPFWSARCPLHKHGGERNPSLRLWVSPAGKLVARCYVCGDAANPQIFQSLGIPMTQLFPDYDPDGNGPRRACRPRAVRHFVYADERGRPLHRETRWEWDDPEYEAKKGKKPKRFSQERWDDQREAWVPGLGEHPKNRRVLYLLPLLAQHPGARVYVVEGAAKAELLAGWGLLATCNTGGAGMGGGTHGWLPEYSRTLAGREVVLMPDNNAVGYRHMDAVAGSLTRKGAAAVGWLRLPGLPEGGDVIDWHRAGGTADAFAALAARVAFWRRCKAS